MGESYPAIWALGILLLLCSLFAGAPECRAEEASSPAATASGDSKAGQSPASQATPSQPSASTSQAATASRRTIGDCAGGEAFRVLANTANSPAIVYMATWCPPGVLWILASR